MPVYETVAVKDITVAKDFNPRTTTDAEDLAQLAESIRAMGVLQPLTLARRNGKLTVIDGHRRLAAAKTLKLDTVPALVEDATDSPVGDQLPEALVVNLRRENLGPVDEARAYHRLMSAWQVDADTLAKRLGTNADRVRARLRLLDLPETAQDAVAAKQLPLNVVGALERITSVSPAVAQLVVQCITEYEWEPSTITGDMTRLMDTIARHVAEHRAEHPDLVLVPVPGRIFTRDLDAEKYPDAVAALTKLEKADEWAAARLEVEDADAARAFGCFIDNGGTEGIGKVGWITDGAFAADRVTIACDRQLNEIAKRKQERKQAGGLPSTGMDTSPDDVKAARAKQREQDQKQRVSARRTNLALGALLYELRGSPAALRTELTRVVCLRLLHHEDDTLQQSRLAWEAQQTETTMKNGNTKVTYAQRRASVEAAIADVLATKDPHQMVARTMAQLLAGWCSDKEAVAMSDRGGGYMVPYTRAENDALVAVLASDGFKTNKAASALRNRISKDADVRFGKEGK